MARILLDEVTKVFGSDVVAVDHVSMEIADGEFMVLVGPSGCGKSTLLRIVAGLEELTDGEVVIGDRIVTDLPPRDRDIAMVFQNYALYPHMSVAQNLELGLKLRKTPKRRAAGEGDRGGPRAGPGDAARPPAGAALGRPAAAGGDGPGDGARAAGVPDGRAAVEPRRQAARADAGRAGAAARHAAHHHHLRHPRPDRGDDAGRPGGGDEATASSSSSTGRRRSTGRRPTCSWRPSSGRRR